MTVHAPHPDPDSRAAFLVDGCPRCAEYVDGLGLPFTTDRWRAFWQKMIAVEFDDDGGYASEFDKELGRKLYYVALGLERAGVDPTRFFEAGR